MPENERSVMTLDDAILALQAARKVSGGDALLGVTLAGPQGFSSTNVRLVGPVRFEETPGEQGYTLVFRRRDTRATAFQTEVRADLAPSPMQQVDPHLRGPAPRDARAIAAAKGLKIWNGGGMGAVRYDEVARHGQRDASSVHVYACAKSRAELLRMIAAYQGLPGPERLTIGFATLVKTHWSEGAWGTSMKGIEPEPGLWVQWRPGTTPVRVWPKEKAE